MEPAIDRARRIEAVAQMTHSNPSNKSPLECQPGADPTPAEKLPHSSSVPDSHELLPDTIASQPPRSRPISAGSSRHGQGAVHPRPVETHHLRTKQANEPDHLSPRIPPGEPALASDARTIRNERPPHPLRLRSLAYGVPFRAPWANRQSSKGRLSGPFPARAAKYPDPASFGKILCHRPGKESFIVGMSSADE
jgi:hypothetical protein